MTSRHQHLPSRCPGVCLIDPKRSRVLITTFSSACELADRLPALLASFMEIEVGLSRNFREDTLSDLIVAALLQLPGHPVAVLTPDETRTGSDFDLELVDPATGTTIRYRIQAKRLGKPTAKWQTRSYHHLAHPKETGKQATVLCDPVNLSGPVPTIPLYAFFNHETVCAASGVPGVALADALEIKDLISTSLAKTPRPLFKRITAVQHLFFELPIILCPPAKSGRGIATPRESRDSFEQVSRARRRSEIPIIQRPEAPQPGRMQPEQIEALRGREERRVRRDGRAKRPRVIVATSELPEVG